MNRLPAETGLISDFDTEFKELVAAMAGARTLDKPAAPVKTVDLPPAGPPRDELAERFSDWRQKARCQGASYETFFPKKGPATAARAICAACKVIEPCLIAGLKESENQGIWGGADPKVRYPLKRILQIGGTIDDIFAVQAQALKTDGTFKQSTFLKLAIARRDELIQAAERKAASKQSKVA